MQRNLDALHKQTFDLLVLGGGITGAGVALDATLRGLRVALIDKGDFASGTSSISSKLVHGGLRYLEHGNIGLVCEALQERGLLLRNAPHLVRPLRFVLPFYNGSRVPAWKWRLGLTVYDFLAGTSNINRSRPLDRRHLVRKLPGLQTQNLAGAAQFYDACMDDARLCLEVVKTATEHGAVAANYVEVVAFERVAGTIQGVQAIDRADGRELRIAARLVVNATGPWVDDVCRLAGDDDGPRLQPTKGVHLILPGRSLPAALLLLHPRDGRVFFIVPWLGKTLVGTTDTDDVASPDEVVVTDADVEYLLEGYNHFLAPPVDRAGVLNTFAGLRPLLNAQPGEPSARSREYRLFWSQGGLLSVVGGKYTTYRHMAEVVTDALVARLGMRRKERTRRQLLDGAPREPWSEFRDRTVPTLRANGVSAASAHHLVHRYGQRALDIHRVIVADPALAAPVHPDEPDLCAEFVYQREHEMALFTHDFLLRRTRIGLFHPQRHATPSVEVELPNYLLDKRRATC